MIDLRDHQKKIYSQYGEDGMIECILRTLGIEQGWCCEVGAWDGIHLSNIYNLIEKGWNSVSIEGDPSRFFELEWNLKEFPNAHAHLAFVNLEPETKLNKILARYQFPSDFDVLSIDVDSYDYWIWASLTFSPKIVVIEYNCNWKEPITIPYQKEQEAWDWSQYFGASACALQKLGHTKGYDLIGCSSLTNLLFLKRGLNRNRFRTLDLSTEEYYAYPHHKEMNDEQKASLIYNPCFSWEEQVHARN